jgi:hypothetical protein
MEIDTDCWVDTTDRAFASPGVHRNHITIGPRSGGASVNLWFPRGTPLAKLEAAADAINAAMEAAAPREKEAADV